MKPIWSRDPNQESAFGRLPKGADDLLSLPSSPPVSTLLVGRPENCELMLAWLSRILQDDLEVVGAADYGDKALAAFFGLAPDLVILHPDGDPLLRDIPFHNPWPAWEEAEGDKDLAEWVVTARCLKRAHPDSRAVLVCPEHSSTVSFAFSAGLLASIWVDDPPDRIRKTLRTVAGVEPGLRIVRFPEVQSLGLLHLIPTGPGILVYTPAWLGEARGTKLVPLGQRIRLEVAKGTRPDLSLLRTLDQDDISALRLSGADLVDNDLRYLSHMSGLGELYLDDTNIGDEGLAHLAHLSHLSTLSLNRTRVTDRGLECLRGLTSLSRIEVVDTAVSLHSVESFPSVGFVVSRDPFSKDVLQHLAARRIGDWFVAEDLRSYSLLLDEHW